MKERLKSDLKKISPLFAAGFAYYFICKYTHLSVPCLFNKITGLLCPACGISRMLVCVLSGDFRSAYEYNRLLFCTLPLILSDLLFEEIRFVKTGERRLLPLSRAFVYLEIAALILFAVIRNIL